mgnify:CR=1 FL=1
MKQEIDYARFGRDFISYYLQNGFGSRSKSDMDCEIYSLLCDCGQINDSLPSITLGLQLRTNASVINNCRQYRFYQHKLSQKQQDKDVLNVLSNNLCSINKDKWLVFTIHNVATKLRLENLLQEKEKNYDYSFNSSNIKLSISTFAEIYITVGGDFEKIITNVSQTDFLKEKLDLKGLTSNRNDKISTIKNIVDIFTNLGNGIAAFKNIFGF